MKWSLLPSDRVLGQLAQHAPWPFPVSRAGRTSAQLTRLFLAFAARDDLVVEVNPYDCTMSVSCALGKLAYSLSACPGRVALAGSFTRARGAKERWDDELPSRWAVRQLVRAVDRRRFCLESAS